MFGDKAGAIFRLILNFGFQEDTVLSINLNNSEKR